MKTFTKFIITSLFLVLTVNAKAVVVSLSPSIQSASVNNQVLLDVFYDTDGLNTVGGAFSVNFDNQAFSFLTVEFDSSLPDDPFFRVFPTEAVNSSTFNLGFGDFAGIEGSGKVATLTFLAEQEGIFDFFLDTPLVGHDSFTEETSYINAQVQVNPVPLPAASWLLISSFISLVVVGRRKHSS